MDCSNYLYLSDAEIKECFDNAMFTCQTLTNDDYHEHFLRHLLIDLDGECFHQEFKSKLSSNHNVSLII